MEGNEQPQVAETIPFPKANGSAAEVAQAAEKVAEVKVNEAIGLQDQINALNKLLKTETINKLLERRNALIAWQTAGSLQLQMTESELRSLGWAPQAAPLMS